MEDALREMRAALDLDPLSVPINWDIAAELINLKRYDEALRQLDKASELFPGVPIFSYMKVLADYRKGDFDTARNIVEPLRKQPELMKAGPSFAVTVNAPVSARASVQADAATNTQALHDRTGNLGVPEMRATASPSWQRRSSSRANRVLSPRSLFRDQMRAPPGPLTGCKRGGPWRDPGSSGSPGTRAGPVERIDPQALPFFSSPLIVPSTVAF